MWFDQEPKPSVLRSRYLKDQAEKMAKGPATSTHSSLGMTMKVILRRLEEAKVPYRIDAVPATGYVITSWPEKK